jgi:uncharacterized protein
MSMPSTGTRKKNKTRQKHIPTRMCAVCRETNAKRTLARIVRTGDNSYQVDLTGRANGRGAYICDKPSCWDKAGSGPILARALRVEPDEDSVHKLREFAAGLNLEAGADNTTVGLEEKAR